MIDWRVLTIAFAGMAIVTITDDARATPLIHGVAQPSQLDGLDGVKAVTFARGSGTSLFVTSRGQRFFGSRKGVRGFTTVPRRGFTRFHGFRSSPGRLFLKGRGNRVFITPGGSRFFLKGNGGRVIFKSGPRIRGFGHRGLRGFRHRGFRHRGLH